jgi:hypothetical protein
MRPNPTQQPGVVWPPYHCSNRLWLNAGDTLTGQSAYNAGPHDVVAVHPPRSQRNVQVVTPYDGPY